MLLLHVESERVKVDLERIGQRIGKESSREIGSSATHRAKKEYILYSQLVSPNCFPLARICPKAYRETSREGILCQRGQSEYKKQGTDAVVTDEGAHVDFMGSKEPSSEYYARTGSAVVQHGH